MGNWGISPNASDKEKIKAEYADYLHGLNSCGEIPYNVYSEAFDIGMDLMDSCYEQGKRDASLWISVDERLPERDADVLVRYVGINSGMDYYQVLHYYAYDDEPHFQHMLGNKIARVTHWQPLPEPPKMDAQEGAEG